MVAITFLWTVGFFFSCLLVCYPISVNWTGLGWDPHYCVDSSALYISQAWSDVATDVVIMALPIPCIWTLQMPMQKKLAVCGIFLLGALTVAAGIAKMFVYYHAVNQMNDPSGLNVDISYIQTPLVYWPLVESSLGIIGACLPLMRPLFAGVASRGFMRDLRSVEIPTSEQSKTLWNSAEDSRAVEEWNSTISTVRFGSESAPPSFKEKRLPSLPASSLNMLRDTPSEGPWMKGPKVYHNMV
ncbi:MAG: hypothetical protein L6R40_004624 [Gallowayella cf. fulva]|nr:MAG: hypothetical protein L6R40_004624 [Xanthomendoza cf. fulva]